MNRVLLILSTLGFLLALSACNDGVEGDVPGDTDIIESIPDPSATLVIQKSGRGRVQATGGAQPYECGLDCSELLIQEGGGTPTLVLFAHASCGWTFQGWSGDCNGTTSQTVTLNTDMNCTATFIEQGPHEQLQAGETTLDFTLDPDAGWQASSVSRTGINDASWELMPRSLWSIELWSSDPSTSDIELSSEEATGHSCFVIEDGNERGLEMNWTEVTSSEGDRFDVQVVARAVLGEQLVRFRAQVTPNSDSANVRGVGRVNLPILDFKDIGDQSEVFLATVGGIRFKNPSHSARLGPDKSPPLGPIDVMYPGLYNMRFSAIADSGLQSVVVLSVDDPPEQRFELKKFLTWGEPDQYTRMGIGLLPSDPYNQRELSFSGETTLSMLECTNPQACWHDAASWFRAKVDSEGYLTRGPMKDEPASVQSQLRFDLSILIGGADQALPQQDYPEYLAYLQDITQWLQISPEQAITNWFDWHDNVFDHDLPQHLPPKSEYVATVAQARSEGFVVIPYTNTSVWARDLASYTSLDVGENWGAFDRYMEPVLDKLIPKENFYHHALDFGIPTLTDHFMTELYNVILSTHNVNGLYLDYFPMPDRCFAPHHGHPVGGGSSYPDGARALLHTLQQSATAKTGSSLLVTENMGDYYIDYVAIANTYRMENLLKAEIDDVGYIPLFDAAFRDITQMGSLGIVDTPGNLDYEVARANAISGDYYLMDLIKTQIAINLGWAFSAGHHLGLIHRPKASLFGGHLTLRDDPDLSVMMELFGSMVKMRLRPEVKTFLMEGKMATSPDFLSQTFQGTPFPEEYEFVLPEQTGAVPTVFVFAFQNDKGDVAFTLFNWTDEPQPISFVVNPQYYQMPVTNQATLEDTWMVTMHTADSSSILATDLNLQQDWLVPTFESLPSRDPWILLYERQSADSP